LAQHISIFQASVSVVGLIVASTDKHRRPFFLLCSVQWATVCSFDKCQFKAFSTSLAK